MIVTKILRSVKAGLTFKSDWRYLILKYRLGRGISSGVMTAEFRFPNCSSGSSGKSCQVLHFGHSNSLQEVGTRCS